MMASSTQEEGMLSPRVQSPIAKVEQTAQDKEEDTEKAKIPDLDLTAQEIYVLLNKSSRVSRNNRAHW